MLVRALLLLLLLWSPTSGHASDFWDEVRSPGLRAHVALIREAALSLRRDQAGHVLELLVDMPAHFAGRADTLRLRALALGATGDIEHALSTLRQALAVDPTVLDDPQWGAPAALLAAKAEDFVFASDILTRVTGNMPALPVRRELFALLGDMLLAQGPTQVVSAIGAYREALRGEGNNDARCLLGLSLALGRHGERATAVEVAARVTAASRVAVIVGGLPVPDTEKAARLAIAAEVMGDLDAALTQWTAASDGPWHAHATSEAARLQRLTRSRTEVRRP